jgi:transcriptional regulator with XRE-family HTH domain
MVLGGMKLQQFLDLNNISRADFAKVIGVSEVAITRYVGGRRMPRPELLVKIKEATNGAVTPNDFLPEQEAGSAHPFRCDEAARSGDEAQGHSETADLESDRADVAASPPEVARAAE